MNYKILFFWVVNIITAVFFYYSTQSHSRMLEFFLSTSYYFFIVLFLFWTSAVIWFINSNYNKIKKVLYESRTGLIISLLLSIIVFIAVPCELKVLSDEANVMAVSKSMTFQKRVGNVTEGLWYYDNFYPLSEELELRPLTLPFLVHILHSLTGYRVSNVYVVHFFLLFVFLFVVYVYSNKYWGKWWAIAMQLFVLSQPLVSQLATSGGIDFIYMFFFFISMLCLYWFIKNPNEFNLLFLLSNLLLFANTRYEAIFQVFIILTLLLLLKLIKWEHIKNNLLIYSLIPAAMLPSLWQRIFKYMDNELPISEAASFENMLYNTKLFFLSFFDFSYLLPLANIVNIGFLISFPVLIYLLLRSKIKLNPHQKCFMLIAGICLVTMWLIIIIFKVSLVNHPSQSHLFIVFIVVITLVVVWGLRRIVFFKNNPIFVFLLSAMCLVFYLPNAVENRFVNQQLIMREYDFALRFLRTKSDRNFVFIHDRPGLFTIQNYGAVTFQTANSDGGNLLSNYKRHLFKNIYVMQEVEYKTGVPKADHQLNQRYNLITLQELQNTPESFLRISEVLLVNETN